MTEIAEVLSRATMPAMGTSHEWTNVAGRLSRAQYARDLGTSLTSFDPWAQEHMPPTAWPGFGRALPDGRT
jgi:hypothetical protein